MSSKEKLTYAQSFLPFPNSKALCRCSLCSIAWDTLCSPWRESCTVLVLRRGSGGMEGKPQQKYLAETRERHPCSAHSCYGHVLSVQKFLGQSLIHAPLWDSKIQNVLTVDVLFLGEHSSWNAVLLHLIKSILIFTLMTHHIFVLKSKVKWLNGFSFSTKSLGSNYFDLDCQQ